MVVREDIVEGGVMGEIEEEHGAAEPYKYVSIESPNALSEHTVGAHPERAAPPLQGGIPVRTGQSGQYQLR